MILSFIAYLAATTSPDSLTIEGATNMLRRCIDIGLSRPESRPDNIKVDVGNIRLEPASPPSLGYWAWGIGVNGRFVDSPSSLQEFTVYLARPNGWSPKGLPLKREDCANIAIDLAKLFYTGPYRVTASNIRGTPGHGYQIDLGVESNGLLFSNDGMTVSVDDWSGCPTRMLGRLTNEPLLIAGRDKPHTSMAAARNTALAAYASLGRTGEVSILAEGFQYRVPEFSSTLNEMQPIHKEAERRHQWIPTYTLSLRHPDPSKLLVTEVVVDAVTGDPIAITDRDFGSSMGVAKEESKVESVPPTKGKWALAGADRPVPLGPLQPTTNPAAKSEVFAAMLYGETSRTMLCIVCPTESKVKVDGVWYSSANAHKYHPAKRFGGR